MKKLIAILAALICVGVFAVYMALDGEIAGVFAPFRDPGPQPFEFSGEVTGFSISGDPDITAPVNISSISEIERISALFDGAEPSEPVEGEIILRLRAINADGSFEYNILQSGGGMFMQDDESYYIIDAGDFWRFINNLDGFYTYSVSLTEDLPSGYFSERGTYIPAVEINYYYRVLDGSFIKADIPGAQVFVQDWHKNRLPLMEFGEGLADIEAVILADGDEVFRGTIEEAEDFHLHPDRLFEIFITAGYTSPYNYFKGEVTYSYTLKTDAIPVSFEISGSATDLGEAIVLRVHNLPEGAQVICETSIRFRPVFYPDGKGGAVALLPVSYHTTVPGEHFVEMRVGDESRRFSVSVLNTQFEVQRLTVDTSITSETIDSAEANAEYNRVIPPLRHISDDVRHWEGRFGYPVEGGRVSTTFAVIRYINNGTPIRHGALDIALPEGTPVYAPAAGRVMYSGFLKLTGNTIAIEHGFGLKTWYYHMVTLDVETGEMVELGQKIGEVGNTGFSTGPHLHYAMSVNDTFINPDTATHTDIFAFE